MAYNPGVYDRSGEILAQGIIQSTRQLEMRREALKKREEENKQLQSQAKALETLLPVYARNAGVTPEEIDQFLQSSPDESPRARAARLSSAIEGIVGNAALKSKAVQDQELQARIQTQRMQQQAIQRGQQEVDDLNTHIDRILGQSRTNGVLTPEMQQEIDRMSSSPIADLRRSGVRVTPEMIAEITRTQIQSAPRGAPKPMPGSGGFRTINVPGIGDIVLDAATGEPVDGGKIIRPQDKKNDEKALTATEIQQIQALQQAGRDLTSLEGAFASFNDPDWGGPVASRVMSVVKAGTDPKISQINNLVTAATPNLARGVFREVGVLTDADVERYRGLLPLVTDTKDQREQKLKSLQQRMVEQTEETLATLQAAGRDVTGLREKILGDRAKKQAAQGANTGSQTATGSGVSRGNLPDTVRHTDGKEYPIVWSQTKKEWGFLVNGKSWYKVTE